MKIAFYAPMKSPRHPNPSGDRRIAQLLVRALESAGHQIQLASEFRSFDGVGNRSFQEASRQEGDKQARELLAAYRDNKLPVPELWFTYHLYHKAPDWIGPQVSTALKIPFIIAEASYAAKQSGGPWELGLRSSQTAIEMASAVISFNAVDDEGVLPWLKNGVKIKPIPPFIDIQPYADAAKQRIRHRRNIAIQYRIDESVPWLICVAMMRPGDKLRSYELLGSALASLQDRPWQLIVVGDGSARDQTIAALAGIGDRILWLGQQAAESLPGIYAASDLYVWPAIGEAFGMSFLETQAAGVPVIAGNIGGVPNVVNAPDCAVLVEPGSSEAFAQAVSKLLDAPEIRRKLAAKAQQHTWENHGLEAAASALNRVIDEIATCRA